MIGVGKSRGTETVNFDVNSSLSRDQRAKIHGFQKEMSETRSRANVKCQRCHHRVWEFCPAAVVLAAKPARNNITPRDLNKMTAAYEPSFLLQRPASPTLRFSAHKQTLDLTVSVVTAMRMRNSE